MEQMKKFFKGIIFIFKGIILFFYIIFLFLSFYAEFAWARFFNKRRYHEMRKELDEF